MKNTKAVSGALILAFGVLFHARAQDSFTNGLVAYFPFNANANDTSGNGNHGTVSGATLTSDRFGITNAAYYFSGDGSHISVPDSSTLDITNALTLCLWVKIEAGGLYSPRLLHKHVFDLGLTDTSGSPQLFFNIQNYPSGGASIITPPLPPNRWVFLVGTYDRQTLKLYADGSLVTQANATVPIDVNTLPVGIGRNLESGTDWLKGGIDDIRIYSRALSSNEVAQLYALESPPRVNLRKAVYLDSPNLRVGTNYQLQVSTDLTTWTNHGSIYTATNSVWRSTNYWDVDNWERLFFRLQVSQ